MQATFFAGIYIPRPEKWLQEIAYRLTCILVQARKPHCALVGLAIMADTVTSDPYYELSQGTASYFAILISYK